MDVFESALPTLGEIQERLRQACICAECPTYTTCAGEAKELLYCIIGISPHCIKDDLGCICPSCPVADEIGLVNLTFCLLGTESAQRHLENIR
jgi:hypothetical protein